MALGPKAHRFAVRAIQINGKDQAAPDLSSCLVTEKPDLFVKLLQGLVLYVRRASSQAELVQARALVNQDGEGIGRDLGIERTSVTRRHSIELPRPVGDHAGKDIEPAGRRLRVRH